MDRLSWDSYFSIMALWVSKRSPDISTKHGCVAVNKKNQIIGVGYNGFVRGTNDNLMPQERPLKYDCILHSEENCILNCNSSLENATLFITGFPCVKCWRLIIQSGIKKVIYGSIKSNHSQSIHLNDNQDNKLINLMLDGQGIEIVEWKPDNKNLILENLKEIVEGV
jgi:dCMP deaminase